MIIRLENGKFTIISDQERKANREAFEVKKGNNGKNYVTRESVPCNLLNIFEGNTKTGEHCVNYNMSIEYTCSHCCECYLLAKCYAETGCYLFADNQAKYTENVNFYNNVTSDEFIKALQLAIDTFKYNLFRYFTCGDIPNYRFVDIMVTLAKNNPDINFWSYTKKYEIVNSWIDKNGDLPENLTIIFSHWLNDDGTYYPMDNRHNLPTSEFIPLGKEYLTETVDFICPCSDSSVKATCETCDHPCYKLQKGQKQALLEHSTKETKARDKMIREAKKAIK